MRRFLQVILAVAVGLGATGATANPFTPHLDAQRRVAQTLEPAPLVLPVPSTAFKEVVPVRLRFWADDEYRAGTVRWQERLRTQLVELNRLVEGAFGVRLEAVGFKRWDRKASSGNAAAMLSELEVLDPGDDADWVIGLVAPLPQVSSSMHALGFARPLGRHFLMRAMVDVAEAQVISSSFHLMDPDEREGLYTRRKAHKERAIFLHEWFHTLALPHASHPQRVMNPGYTHHMTGISPTDAELVATALHARLRARGVGEPDWSQVAKVLDGREDPAWNQRERRELITFLRGGDMPTTRGDDDGEVSRSSAAPSMNKEEADRLDRALELAQKGRLEQAWTEAQPLRAQHMQNPSVARLLCRLGHAKSAGEEGVAACARARALHPHDPMISLDAGQTLALRKDYAGALAAADEAVERARARGAKGSPESWLWIAQLYTEVGAYARAAELLVEAGEVKGAAEAGAELERRRGWAGLKGGTFKLPAEQEPGYVAMLREGQDLLVAGKRKEARVRVTAGLKAYPGAPGLETLACELALREGKAREAEQRCARAIKGGDVARAYYLLGHIRFQTRRLPAAVTAFKRAIAIEPQDPSSWEVLAEAYRMTGKRQELQALKAQHEKVFGKPMR